MGKILLGIIIFSVLFLVYSVLYVVTGIGKWLFHDKMGWHKPDEDYGEGFDGISFTSKCKYCGKDIMQDSQGNWY